MDESHIHQHETGAFSSSKLALVASQTDNSVIITDHHGQIEWVNQAFTRLTGYMPHECRERTPGTLLQGPATDPATRAMMRERLAQGVGFSAEILNYRKDGSEFWIAMEVRPVNDPLGKVTQFIGIGVDITARRKAEIELVAAHAENELLLATISSGLIGLDINERVSRWNKAAERILGIPSEQALGRTLGETGMSLDWADLILGMNTCLSEGRTVDLQAMFFRRPDGSEGTLDVSIVSSWARQGDGLEGLGMILTITDSTERKLAALQRLQGQKMESIGQLAAGVAHEINTPIQFVGDNMRFLKDAFDDLSQAITAYGGLMDGVRAGSVDQRLIDSTQAALAHADVEYLREEIPKAIAQSLEGIARVADIVRAMKEFSHPDQGERKPTDLNRAIQTTITVARNEYKYVADLVTDFDASLPLVPCIIGEFNQVVLNLVVNAAHAIGDVTSKKGGKGTITVSTRGISGWAEVRIRDSGTGIPESIRGKIFDPFFTTKGVGKGTGQGLYIAHTVVVKKHGGTIEIETAVGEGTTFVIRLPLRQEGT